MTFAIANVEDSATAPRFCRVFGGIAHHMGGAIAAGRMLRPKMETKTMVRALILAAALTLPMAALPMGAIAQDTPAPQSAPAPAAAAKSGDTITAADALGKDAADPDRAGVAEQAETGQPLKRIRNIALTGTAPCPKASDPGEVVVCSRIDEPYRIPKPLRDQKPIPASGQSWVNRSATIDDVGRKAAGLPDSCSPVGSGGQTGCTAEMLREWTAEKVAKKNGQSIDPNNP